MGDLIDLEERRRDLRVDPGPTDAPEGPSRPPPHDLDAEAASISACVLETKDGEDGSPSALSIGLGLLRPEHFYSEANSRIWQAIQKIHAIGEPIDMVTIGSWLHDREWLQKVGGSAYLAQVIDATPRIGHVAAHIAKVIERFERRQFIATLQKHAAEARGDCGDWEAYKARVRPVHGQLTAPKTKLAGKPIHDVVKGAREHVQQATNGVVSGVNYPWPKVGGMAGMLFEARQTVLAGISEHGKTAAMIQICVAVAATPLDKDGFGEAVYVHSGEMPAVALLTRAACSFAGVDVMRVETGNATPGELVKVQRELDALERLPIIIDDQAASPAEIAKRVRQHRAVFAAGKARRSDDTLHPKCRLRLVAGDHLQDLARFMPQREERERIGACALAWDEEIAKGCKVATLLLSQLSDPEPPKGQPAGTLVWPTCKHLFGAPTTIKASADTVIAVTRPELIYASAGHKVPAKWLGVIAFSRLKSRFGGSERRVLLGYDLGYITDELPAAARGEAYYDSDD